MPESGTSGSVGTAGEQSPAVTRPLFLGAGDVDMSKLEKLIASILANPRGVRFEEACRVASVLGFIHEGGRGSHRVFKRKGESTQLNFQNRNGLIPAYQAHQLVAMIRKYGEDA
jgi:hypothetical protein